MAVPTIVSSTAFPSFSPLHAKNATKNGHPFSR
jgi:hypothetical protein